MSEYSAELIRILVLSVYFKGLFDVSAKWINSMRVTWVPMVIQVVATGLQLLCCYLFVTVWDLDVKGIAYATLIKDFSLFVRVIIPFNFVAHMLFGVSFDLINAR